MSSKSWETHTHPLFCCQVLDAPTNPLSGIIQMMNIRYFLKSWSTSQPLDLVVWKTNSPLPSQPFALVDDKKVTSMLSPPPSRLMLRPRSSWVTLDLLSIMEEPVTTIRILSIEFQPCLPPSVPVRILGVELRPYLPPPGPLLELGAPVSNADMKPQSS